MKSTIGKVTGIGVSGGSFRFPAENGQLSVTVISEKTILFEYSVDGYKIPRYLTEASEKLYSYEIQDIVPSVDRADDGWAVTAGRTVVSIDAATALVSVTRGGKPVHGGRAGGRDTVIPQSQFRLAGSRGSETGSFTFALDDGDGFYGLGDKAGSPDHRGTRVRMYNRDSLGYDASFSDPLYKSIPFVIKVNRSAGTCAGLFFPETCVTGVDMGKESPFFWSVDVLGGPFRYFLILGDDYRDIMGGYCRLTGFPALPPLYSFGYFGSSMNYVEAWDAQARMEKFFSDVEKNNLPCEGMYVSSGYLKTDDGLRHAFMWNRRKFPDPGSFLENLCARGYHLTFNIKPGILLTHPWYAELADKGYFVKDNGGRPVVEYFWGGDASFIDFSNTDAVAWWKQKLCESYLDHGVEGIWNDNNEFEMDDPETEAYRTRTVFPVLMAKASYEACLGKNPGKRPWIYSRSGYAGMQKYARTWTGDNSSNFRTLKFNQFQGISLGLSGVPFVGHDLGGFYGPEPSPELLVRCAQSAIFQSRFVIHSWRENDEPTEPWKFGIVFPLIREALIDHYRHMPYIYSQAHESSRTGVPLERPLCLEYSSDSAIRPDIEQFMFGSSVMKAPVLNEGENVKHVRFPSGDDWYSPHDGRLFRGGDETDLDAPLERTWYFYKAGSIIPRTEDTGKLTSGFFRNLDMMVLPTDGTFTYEYVEDDGVSVVSEGSCNRWRFSVTYDEQAGKGDVRVQAVSLGRKDALEGRSVRMMVPEGFEGTEIIAMKDLDGTVFRFSGKYDIVGKGRRSCLRREK